MSHAPDVPHVLVTRPQPQAGEWAGHLRGAGLPAEALPLIAIEAPADASFVRDAWRSMATYSLLMFVSPAAVAWFFRLRPVGAVWSPDTWAACPGPGTARSVLAYGGQAGLGEARLICPDVGSEQFDSEALWPLLAPMPWRGRTVGIVSGGDAREAKGRNWLAAQWQQHGAEVRSILAYQRCPSRWDAAQRALARQALDHPEHAIWLFSSSQAIEYLAAHHLQEAVGGGQVPWARMRAVVTHPRIAEAACAQGMTRITQTRPTLDAVVQALRSAA